jgi:GNAT superfamily N-acetyltransferase
MENESIRVRVGTEQDVPAVLGLIKELATYERAADEVSVTLDQLTDDGFGPNAIYGLFVAETDSNIVGIALYYEKYSTWKGRCLYLEDIIVTEKMRGKGIGAQLFEAVIQVAKKRNSARMEWQVLNWNEPAIGFYKKYEAELDPEWLNGKLTQQQIQSYK